MSVTTPCTYHPTQPALYHCSKCGADFCPDCISKQTKTIYGSERQLFFCPKCNIAAELLSVGDFIAPFWNRLHKFFVYPLQPKPLLLITLLALIGLMLSGIPFAPLILWAVSVKYSFAVLRNTVKGNLRPPDLSYEVIGKDMDQAFKQLALFTVVGIALGVVFGAFGNFIGIICVLFALLLMPAMIIVLVISNSLANALNPVAACTIAYRIGWGYLLMYLFLALLLGAPAILVQSFSSFLHLPVWLRHFLFIAANQYYTIISYNLMGYVILQYHEDIGYEVDAAEFVDQASVMKADSASSTEAKPDAAEAILNRVDMLVKDGRAEDAVFFLRDRMQRQQPDAALYERYYNLLRLTQRIPEMMTHGIAYLDVLAAQNEKTSACDIYRECVSHDFQFTPNADALFKLAEWCMDDGDPKNGMNALVKFIKTNPEHALAPKAHFLFGKNVYEKLHNSDRAAKVLQVLIRKYPNHDMSEHARKYLEQMNRAAPKA